MRKKISRKTSSIELIVIVLVIGIIIGSYFIFFHSPYKLKGDGPVKILYVDGYHEGYGWSDGQLSGFKDAFEKENIKIDIKRIEIDSERNKETEFLEQRGQEAKDLVEEWKPDLIFVTDDNAQKYFGRYYVNSNIPLVYSGIVLPEEYGYENANNIGGVLEIIPFAKGIDFARDIIPNIKKVVLITNPDETGMGFYDIAKKSINSFPDIDFQFKTANTFKEYEQIILKSQDADLLVEMPLLNFVDDNGEIVPTLELQKWNVKNSNIPELTFWDVLEYDGVLLNYAYSPDWDGQLAGEIAINILINGKKPSDYSGQIVNKGKKIINLARAQTLGIQKENIPSIVLINSDVIEKFPWEEKE